VENHLAELKACCAQDRTARDKLGGILKRILLGIICLTILALSSSACSSSPAAPADYSKPDTVITATLPPQDPAWEAKWQDEVWVFPASIQIGSIDPSLVNQHYQAGIKIIYPIVIHADEQATQFHLTYLDRDYGDLSSTYLPSPAKAIGWVSFSDPNPYLAAYETREVNVEFFVPKNANAPSRWEFMVRVDWEQEGFFQQARGIIFQINMKAINA